MSNQISKVGLIKEPVTETRVALLPEDVRRLVETNPGVSIVFESNLAVHIGISDSRYLEAGAIRMESSSEIIDYSDVIVCIQPVYDLRLSRKEKIFVGWFNCLNQLNHLSIYKEGRFTILSLDLLPRTTIAQRMDSLSSMASLNGYKAVIKGTDQLGLALPMMTTAAGTIKPGNTLVVGAGVAGLQAIATAKRLGARVSAFDVRAAAAEEARSLGARFLEVKGEINKSSVGGYAVEQSAQMLKEQQELLHEAAISSMLIICTAQIPGRRAPVLITEKSIYGMQPGSVIVDLAAETGGNTELTEKDKTIEVNGVTIIGNSNLHREIPYTASRLLSSNFYHFIHHLLAKGMEDDLILQTAAVKSGRIIHPKIIQLIEES